MIAFRRDLVVLDCQPPSNTRTKSSPTSAILLPWRYTQQTDHQRSQRGCLPVPSPVRQRWRRSSVVRSYACLEVVCLNWSHYRHRVRPIGVDAVPLVSLVGKHALMGIQHEIDDIIGGRHVETIAEPVHAHLGGCHSVKHEILQVLQGLRRGEKCVSHVPIISTGSDRSRPLVCHLSDRTLAAAQFFTQTHAMLQYHKPEEMWARKLFITWHVWFMRMHTKNATMYTLHDRILKCGW